MTVAAPLLIVVLSGRNFMAQAFATRVPYFLGEISYAVYLAHGSFLRIRRLGHAHLDGKIGEHDTTILCAVLFYPLVIVTACILYKYVEKPGRRHIRNLESLIWPDAEKAVSQSEALGVDSLKPPLAPP